MTRSRIARIVAAAALAALVLGCKESNRQNSPVQLIVTTNQVLQRIDLATNAVGCDQAIGTVLIRALIVQNTIPNVNLPVTPDLDNVKINSYRVTYVRTDGGTLVPAPFTRSISLLVTTGGAGETTNFIAFQPDALTQAPFAALFPNNGGKDPQTGRPVVQMDIILEVFGETLAGERVSGATRIPLDFCVSCSGCA